MTLIKGTVGAQLSRNLLIFPLMVQVTTIQSNLSNNTIGDGVVTEGELLELAQVCKRVCVIVSLL